MDEENIYDPEKALRQLVLKGYNYWLLEKKYGENRIDEKKIWDIIYDKMLIESLYLYYKMRLREAIEELQKLSIMSISFLSDLESCYERLYKETSEANKENIRDYLEKLKVNKRKIEKYLKEYLLELRNAVDEKKQVNDGEILSEIERLVKEYKNKLNHDTEEATPGKTSY